jgi:hypothetical protein
VPKALSSGREQHQVQSKPALRLRSKLLSTIAVLRSSRECSFVEFIQLQAFAAGTANDVPGLAKWLPHLNTAF